jgi:hypothetical protein
MSPMCLVGILNGYKGAAVNFKELESTHSSSPRNMKKQPWQLIALNQLMKECGGPNTIFDASY